MKIKLIALLLTLATVITLAACGGTSSKDKGENVGGNNDSTDNDPVADDIFGDPFDTNAPNVTTGVPSSNSDNASKGLEMKLNDAGDAYIVKSRGECKDSHVIIPSVYEGKPVTEIAQRAFYSDKGLTEITIPSSVATIGGAAFDMSGLQKVSLSEGLVTINGSAFASCTNLTELTIPNSVKEIGGMAFSRCYKLSKITLPDICYNVGSNILSSTLIYDDASNWDNGVFYYQGYLLGADIDKVAGNITVKSGTKVISSHAFESCQALTGITVADGVKAIGENSFGGCPALVSVSLPDSIVYLRQAFAGSSITNGCNVPVYAGKHLIAANASGDIVVADGTLTIASKSAIIPKSLTLPNSIVFIGEQAFNFRNCDTITYKGTKSEWEAINKLDSWDLGKTGYTIVCTDGTITK